MGRSASGDRTAGCYPRFRFRPMSLPIRSRRFERSTTRRGSACTRGRPARPGWGSAWTWAMRSTCCIPWPTDSRARPGERATRLRRDDRLPTHCVHDVEEAPEGGFIARALAEPIFTEADSVATWSATRSGAISRKVSSRVSSLGHDSVGAGRCQRDVDSGPLSIRSRG